MATIGNKKNYNNIQLEEMKYREQIKLLHGEWFGSDLTKKENKHIPIIPRKVHKKVNE